MYIVHMLYRLFQSSDDQHRMSRCYTRLLQSAVDDSCHGRCLCPATVSAVIAPISPASSDGTFKLHPAVQRLLCTWRTTGALDRVAGGAGAAIASLRWAVRRAAAAGYRQRCSCVGRGVSAARCRRRHGRRTHQGVTVRSGCCCRCCCCCSGERGNVTGITLLCSVTTASRRRIRCRCRVLAAVHVSWWRRVVVKKKVSGRIP